LLVELVVGMAIFSIIFLTLVAVWANVHRNIFSSFRKSYYKNNINVAIKQMGADIENSSRVEVPAPGTTSFMLIGVSNVDNTLCYPQTVTNTSRPDLYPGVTWYVYCLTPPSSSNTYLQLQTTLYYYTGQVSSAFLSNSPGCPPSNSTSWTNVVSYTGGAFSAISGTYPTSSCPDSITPSFSAGTVYPTMIIPGLTIGQHSGGGGITQSAGTFFRRDSNNRIYISLEAVKPSFGGSTTGSGMYTDKPFAAYTTAEFRINGNTQ